MRECNQRKDVLLLSGIEPDPEFVSRLFSMKEEAARRRPLIHCLTNAVTINDCANLILAAGARPIMAEHPEETEEITSKAAALVINTGNITQVRMKSMELSAKMAKEKKIPLVIDCVGASCSTLRREFLIALTGASSPAMIKGNRSEVKAMLSENCRTDGIDAGEEEQDRLEEAAGAAVAAARLFHTTVMVTGAVDIVTDGTELWFVQNGCREMSFVTGTGCMAGMLTGVFLAASRSLKDPAAEFRPMIPAVFSLACFGVCGELACERSRGIGSFKMELFDAMYRMTKEEFEKRCKICRVQDWRSI